MEFDARVIMGGEFGDDYRQSLADNLDDTRSWVDPNGYQLSDRVWAAREADRAVINNVLRAGVANGTSALEVAKVLEKYVNPASGAGNYAARRLARTEITRALGAGTLDAAARNPFNKGVKWALSGSHPRSDLCDPNAGQDKYGLGTGVYPVGQVPRYPGHPNCLCTLIQINDKEKLDQEFDSIIAQISARR